MRKNTRSHQAGSRWHTASEIEELLEGYRNSGLTQRVFAQGAGIGVSTLQLWLRQAQSKRGVLKGKTSPDAERSGISLLEVDLAEASPPAGYSQFYEIELRGGERLRLAAGFADGEVRRLLALLKEAR
jgi:hypothetical protein